MPKVLMRLAFCFVQIALVDDVVEIASGCNTENADHHVHCLVFPTNCAAAVRSVVPVARGSSVQTSSVLLHNYARHDVLERLFQLGELVETLRNYGRSPFIYLRVLISSVTDHGRYRLQEIKMRCLQKNRAVC
jgi:hypothetical protein